ncbi:MAG: hypothetical protein EGR83_10200 [Bacteroides cellulosilyticus]|uniref:hypothetical protein n=1 Tax=Bacteroides cellulosilyticus TaxID=246787 RepID=UPI001D4C3029|nr:hypothetical protein [Bacteroides cellulosilyticus]
MPTKLILHIEPEYIVAIAMMKGRFEVIEGVTDKYHWLYFFNDVNRQVISSSSKYRMKWLEQLPNYYGRFFSDICDESKKINCRGYESPYLELITESSLLENIKKGFYQISGVNGGRIETVVTYSEDIAALARDKFNKYLNGHGLEITYRDINLYQLIAEGLLKQKKATVDGNIVFVSGLTPTFHCCVYAYKNNRFCPVCHPAGGVYSFKRDNYARDPRIHAITRWVVEELDKNLPIISSEEERIAEEERFESKADTWLSEMQKKRPSQPYTITESLSKSRNNKYPVYVTRQDVERDTGRYVREVVDIISNFISEGGIENNLSAIVFIGGIFNNELFRKELDAFADKHRSQTKYLLREDISSILEIYHTLQLENYPDAMLIIREKAKAEKEAINKKEQEKRKKTEEEEVIIRKQEEIKAEQKKRQEYESLTEKASKCKSEKNWIGALEFLKDALRLFPDDTYAKGEAAALEEMIERQRLNEIEYRNIVLLANKKRDGGEEVEAMELYRKASRLKPEEDYPTLEIEKIELSISNKKFARVSKLLSDVDIAISKGNIDRAKSILGELSVEDERVVEKWDEVKRLEFAKEDSAAIVCQVRSLLGNGVMDYAGYKSAMEMIEEALTLWKYDKEAIRTHAQLEDKIAVIEREYVDWEEKVASLQGARSIAELEELLSYYERMFELKGFSLIKERIRKVKAQIEVLREFEVETLPKEQPVQSDDWNWGNDEMKTNVKLVDSDDDFLRPISVVDKQDEKDDWDF